mgnify:CR=1 FL=1
MKKILTAMVFLLYSLLLAVPASASGFKASNAYLDTYFTAVAAASCVGVYLPNSSSEFSYLRSYGWDIEPKITKSGEVETNFAIAENYFPEIGKRVFLVTFRGSASGSDWKQNLKTHQVRYEGSDIASMEAAAKMDVPENFPAVHAGFNEYTMAMMKTSVLDANGNFRSVFKTAMEDSNTFLVITGHSLGGAAATLLGERLVSMGMPKDRFVVITFGAPAVGNAAFAETYGDKIRLLRISNRKDPIPGSLQTFFGGYKQFGEKINYSMTAKVSSVQHDMTMYFDYSVNQLYKAFDAEIAAGRLKDIPNTKEAAGVPKVALWIAAPENLDYVAYVTDIKRMLLDEYRRVLPSYIVLDKALHMSSGHVDELENKSRLAGADYIVVCGIDGRRSREQEYWYLELQQSIFTADGKMLSLASFGKKVAPGIGNIQAAGENFLEAKAELHKQLPFVIMQQEPKIQE